MIFKQYIYGATAIILASSFGFNFFQGQRIKSLTKAKIELAAQLEQSKQAIEATQLAREAEQSQDRQSYQDLSNSCQARIVEAVRITKLKPKVMYEKSPNGNTCECPLYELRDIQSPPNNTN